MRFSVVLYAALLAMSSCSSDAAPPEALVSYLDLLVEGDLDEAYDRTQLSEIGAFTRSAALSKEHFISFYEADPITGYEIGRVIAYRPDGQDPFWDTEVTLRTGSGSRPEDFQVEGEVLGVVTVQPVTLHLQVPSGGVPEVLIDGVAVDVSDTQVAATERTWQLLVLNGAHRLEVSGRKVDFSTSPPMVTDGPASFVGDADRTGGSLLLVVT